VSTRAISDKAVSAEPRGVAPEDAVTAWLAALDRAGAGLRPESTTVALFDALGSVFAEPVCAVRCSLAFAAAAMDALAVASPPFGMALEHAGYELCATGRPDVRPARARAGKNVNMNNTPEVPV
jgi:molybdopterin biosynthesis enzyme